MNKAVSPIRIVYVIGQLTIGGTEHQLLELVRNLNHDRFKILVVCLSNQAPLSNKFVDAGCELHIINREKRGRLLILGDLYRLFRMFRPDIVHSYAYSSRAAIPLTKIFFNSKNIVSIRTQPGWQVNSLDRFVNSFADYILTNSKKADSSIHFGFRKTVPHRVIYNGIDLKRFDVDAGFALELPLTFDTKIIAVVARLHTIKGLNILLDAFSTTAKSMTNVSLWVIGDGPEKKNLQQKTYQLNIASKVFFLGQQNNISAILRYVDIGVLSSFVEGLPNAIIEYMAAKLPVVATNVGGIPELITHGTNGFLVEPGNPNEIANALLILLKDKEMSKRFGENGRLFVERNFDMKRMVNEMDDIYETVCFRK